jgi:pyrimidine operon attenuation protein/uracil phosphoribosyltransferase
MEAKLLFHPEQMQRMIERLALQIWEEHPVLEDLILLGVQPRGVILGNRLYASLRRLANVPMPYYGQIDPTFYRDDFRRRNAVLQPNTTKVEVLVEGRPVVLIDDVLFTGRTIRAAMDALQAFGRPSRVRLLCLIDRSYSRELPIQADYKGVSVDAIAQKKIKVHWQELHGEDAVWLVHESNLVHS